MSLPEGFSGNARNSTAPKPLWPLRLLLALALVSAIASMFMPVRQSAPADAFAIVLAAAASVAILARTLPLQSVLFAALITALIGGAGLGLSAQTGLPFGPVSFGDIHGPLLFNCVPWKVPFLWIVAILNSRGVARLVLRPWRKVKNYGFLLMTASVVLTLAFALALEPFARAKHLWLWQPTKISLTWQGASPLVFLGWTFVTGLILAVIMPYLIRKQPGNPSAPDFTPLALWLGAMVVFGTTAARAEMWLVVALDGILSLVVAGLSWRGAKW